MLSDTELARIGLSASAVRLVGPLVRLATALLLVALLIAQVGVLSKLAVDTATRRQLGDFGIFYQSGQLILEGRSPYARLIPLTGGLRRAPNLLPPHAVAAVLPLAVLPPLAALILWSGASLIGALVAVALIFREARLRPTWRTLAITALVLTGTAATGALVFSAQITWLLWPLVTAAWVRARHGRWSAAAVLLGIAASIKPFLGFFVLTLLAARKLRESAIMIGVAAACFAVGIVALGLPVFADWIDTVRAVQWAGHVWNASAFAVVHRTIAGAPYASWYVAPVVDAPALVLTVWVALTATIAAVTIRAAGRTADAPGDARRTDELFALTLPTCLLLSPLGWIYYAFFPAGPIVALLRDPAWRSLWRTALILAALGLFALTPGALTLGQPNGVATLTLGSAYFWGLFAVWLACARPAP